MDFDRLANRHRDAVYAQMVRLCGNRDDAEDALVEALIAAYRSLPQLRDDEAFRGWLAKIARRACYRLKDRPEIQPLVEFAAVVPGPDEDTEQTHLRTCIESAIRDLPDSYREVYELRDLAQFSGPEVAMQLGLSLPAVKSRLLRARGMIREKLETSLCSDESFTAQSASG